jgi:glycosyltransferase involved in cell wall biosynthesis
MKLLYISYDGILEPLGQSQILSYLENLSLSNKIYLLTFEKKNDLLNIQLCKDIDKRIKNSNIEWYKFKYHKYPLFISTLFDIFCGFLFSLKIIIQEKIIFIHARSYVPAFIAMLIKSVTGIKFIFDMRGFWVDEKVDAGIWKKNSIIFNLSKKVESKILRNSDHIITLTNSGKKILKRTFDLEKKKSFITVIPTCVNIKKFYSKNKKIKNFTFGYVGTVNNWYNFDLVLRYFRQILLIKKESKLIIVNKNQHHYILNRIKSFNVPLKKVCLKSSDYSNIPRLINQMSVGIFFIRPTFSKKASCPTKLAEFLSCGVPIITGPGVGDVVEIIQKENVGIILKSFTAAKIRQSFKKIIRLKRKKNISKQCRLVAKKYFSLEEGTKKFNQVYCSINANLQ